MKIAWTRHAVRRLHAIRRHLQDEGAPVAADRVVRELVRRAMSLSAPGMSRLGRAVPEYRDDTLRELPCRPYRLIYRIGIDRIDIVEVVHGRRLLRGDMPTPHA